MLTTLDFNKEMKQASDMIRERNINFYTISFIIR